MITLAVIFGFRNQSYSNSNKLLLFDACFDYINSNSTIDNIDLKQDLTECTNNVQSNKLIPIVPDSTVKPFKPVKIDSVKIHVSPGDSLRIKTKQDSLKRIENLSKGSTNVPSNKLIPIKPDSTVKPIKPVKNDSEKIHVFSGDSLRIKTKQDSLKRIENLSKDSTARIKYFHFYRDDYPNVLFRGKKKSSFFVYPSENMLSRTVQLDPTGKKVIIKETIAGKPIREYLELPIDEYIKLKLETIKRDVWEQKGYEYKLKDTKKDLSQLITDITNIEIPLPSTPLLSIFGPPHINLKIAGQVDIHGAWRNETTTGITTSALGNTRNEPDFKQQVQINLNGTIGDKLTLGADWNTERQFQYENQLKIKYTGYEDEIIQSIEAGNVSLQTSPLVGGSEALFGIKAQFKMGPFSLTALASQKKSEIQEVSVSGGARSQQFEIHAYDYSPNHFFIDSVYADPQLHVFTDYYSNPTPRVNSTLFVKDIQVWKTVTGLFNPNERKANAYLSLPKRSKGTLYSTSLRDSTLQTIPGVQEIDRRFVLLQLGIDYEIHPETGFISFKTQIQEQDAIAVAYYVEGATSTDYYGEFINDLQSTNQTRLVLKLVKPPNLQPQFKKAWGLQLRNIYPVGGRNVKEEGFVLDMKYKIEGQDPQNNFQGTKILEAFGLDKTDKSGTSTQPDGAFDFFPPRTIMPSTGEVIFPVLQPFGRDFPSKLPDSLKYQSVYDTLVTFAKQDRTKDKFIMSGEYSAEVTSVYSIGFQAVEKSVKVYLNGNLLKEGIDYTVDYNLGQVLIRNDKALVPGADLKISYEQNDLFQLASKTLLGLRGLFEFNKETSLGFSYLNLNQQTLSDKVRIGEEPQNNSIFGVDFKTNINLPFITKALDKVISTSAPSNFSLIAEYAHMSPDPNTKKSTITSDNNKSIAYVDDFEGAKKLIPLGMPYGSWHDISVPNNLPFIGSKTEMEQMAYKAKTYWYNRTPSDVTIKDIYGNRRVNNDPSAQLIQTLDFVFQPDQKGFYNWYPTLGEKFKNWGGIMKVLSSTANNLVEENIQFIEFWLNIPNAPSNLKLNIDLGQISEDVIPNGKLDTEDKNRNGLLDDGEDTGIDGLKDTEEPGYDSVTNPDPSGDNYSFQLTQNPDYSHVNGTEGNGVSIDQGRIPDSEDLNGNLTLDRVNSYFRYEIPIDTNRVSNKFIVGGGDNAGWYLFRIPLKDFATKIGDPSFSVIEFIRFWVSGVDQPVHLRFAEMNLVGNQWQKVLSPPKVTLNDTVLTVSSISKEDNPEYSSPPGVFPEKDRTTTYDVFKNEQALNLIITKLEDGDNREVVRYLYKPLDLFNYKEMKFFIHSDKNDLPGSVSFYDSTKQNNYGSEVYLRFGSDSLNYYEYRQPVRYNYDIGNNGWNEVSMVFSDLTAIKIQTRGDSTFINKILRVPVPGKVGHTYGVRGNPTLTQVTFFTIGIVNPRDKGTPYQAVSGSVWVNELRVLDADATPGWAYSASGTLSLADLVRVNFNVSQTNPYFHSLTERFGTREDRLNWGVAVDLDVLKLIPLNLAGSNLRVSYSRNQQSTNPLYLPGTDIKVNEAQNELRKKLTDKNYDPVIIEQEVAKLKDESQSLSVSETWTLSSIKIKIPTDVWYIRDTFNNLTFGFNYNKSAASSPTVRSSDSWIWNANANYSVNLSRDNFFRPVDIPIIGSFFGLFSDYRDVKIYFLPQSITSSITASRKRSYTQNRAISDKPNVLRDFVATRGAGFNWAITEGGFWNLSLNYNFDISSTLAYLLANNDLERSESEIWRDVFGGSLFGKDYNFKQSVDLRTNPKLPSIWDLNRYLTLNGSYSVTYQWQNNFTQGVLGKSAGYANRISAGFVIRLKSIFAPMFREEEKKLEQNIPSQSEGGRTGGRRSVRSGNQQNQPQQIPKSTEDLPVKTELAKDSTIVLNDSTIVTKKDTVKSVMRTLNASLEILKLGIKTLLLDYDQITINFSQNSSYTGGGIVGDGTGFNNFWGFSQSDDKGPRRLFMLGLSNDLGPRAPNGNIQDNYTQKNDLSFSTSRPLWEGADLKLDWKVGWGINKSSTIQTDSLGNVSITNMLSTGTLDRSFLSLPPSFIFSFLGNGIKKVHDLYDPTSSNPAQSLSDAFLKGFETFSFLSKIPFLSSIMKYIPRPNWTFTWTGLEKYQIFSFANRVTVNHAYISNYSEGWQIKPDGVQEVQTQRVDYAFSPLAGITMNFDKFFGGAFQSTIRFSTKTSYSLGVTTLNVTEAFNSDINISASYTKSGFELPLFGISLKNDLEISFSYTSGKTSSVIYEMNNFKDNGTPQEGKTNTTIEPKIKYVMSSRVTLSIFYRRTSIVPEGASRIPPTTTNEAGVDVRIAIQ
ncbi:MAG: cell surface protein SprA [Ignavibacteriales bacterium]|nr:cell surface protein SprA [Ignavibacteriales bacterium]